MFDLYETDIGRVAKRAKLLSEGKVWIDTFRNDVKFRTWVLDLIRQDQLFGEGIDSEGDVIGYYSQATARRDPRKPFNSHYTLYDHGDLYRKMIMIVTVDYFEIRWDDKDIREQEWFSDKILGFTDENFEKIEQAYLSKLIEHAETILFGNF